MLPLRLFVPLVKVDESRQEAWGVLAEEAPDKSGEIFDYEGSKPYFKAWSDGFSKATNGRSLGNLRAMHRLVAAGKFISIDFNDAEKRIEVGAKVVDDIEWRKTIEGCYTGFSIGAKYVKTWKDGDLRRYIADPIEGSLVDNPCIPGALFTALKADGSAEKRAFVLGQKRELAQVWSCGIVPGHEHPTKAGATRCIEKYGELPQIEKGMYAVGNFAAVLACLNEIRVSSKYEEIYEGDASPMPAALAIEVEHLVELLMQMVDEETAEMLADLTEESTEIAASAKSRIRKLLARIPASELDFGKSVLERSIATLSTLAEASTEVQEMTKEEIQKAVEETSAKVSAAQTEELKKAVAAGIAEGLGGLEKKLTDQMAEELKKRDESFEKFKDGLAGILLPTGVSARAVSKTEDGGEKEERKPETTVVGKIKESFLVPRRVVA